MIVTTKLPFQNDINLTNRIKLYNSIVRYSYNRFKEGKNQKEIRKLIKDIFPKAESWFAQNAILEGKNYIDRDKNKSAIIFGGKKNLIKRQQNKITNDEWKQLRQYPIYIQGEKPQKGNRFLDLRIEKDNTITIKFNRKEIYTIQLPKLHKTLKKKLIKLEELAKNKQCSISFRIDNNFIWLVYDDGLFKISNIERIDNVVCGIDLNPEHIGLSICEINLEKYTVSKILHKETIDLIELNCKSTNKKKYETIQICKHIEKICNRFKCSSLSIEDLLLKSKDHKTGREINKLLNNDWRRSLLVNNLQKRCDNNNIKFIKINPAYSSTIGNLCYDSVDEVNSSIEIARRGTCKYVKTLCLYPNMNCMKHQWKDDFIHYNSWKDVHNELKNSKVKYRVPLDDIDIKSHHHLVSRKSFIKLYIL